MKHSFLYSFITLSILLSFLSCKEREAFSVLRESERIINDYPDSVLNILKSIPREKKQSPEISAKYNLLLAIALDKCDSLVTDESFLKGSVCYYEKKKDKLNMAKAYYYLGRIQQNRGDYTSSSLSFAHAEQQLQFIKDDRLKYLLYMAIADNYCHNYNSVEELSYTQKALEVVKNPELKRYVPGAQYRYAATLANNKKFSRAIEIMDSLYNNSPAIEPSLRELCLLRSNYYRIISEIGEPADIKRSYEYLLQSGGHFEIEDYCAYAYILGICGEETRASSLFNQIIETYPERRILVIDWESSLAARKGNYTKAYRFKEEALSYQDSIVRVTLQQSQSRIQKEYYQSRLYEEQLTKEQHKKNTIIILGILLLVIVITTLVIIYLWHRNKVSEQYNKTKIDTLSKLIREIKEDKESTIVSLRRSFLSKLFRPLGELYSEYQFQLQHGEEITSCKKKLIKAIEDINITEEDGWFEHTLNAETENLPLRFKGAYPFIKKEDYRLFCYYLAGFDATIISILMHLSSQNAVYIRKTRLRKMIQDSSVREKDLFLDILI